MSCWERGYLSLFTKFIICQVAFSVFIFGGWGYRLGYEGVGVACELVTDDIRRLTAVLGTGVGCLSASGVKPRNFSI